MPVFDFSNPESTTTTAEVTYTTFHSDKNVATPADPLHLRTIPSVSPLRLQNPHTRLLSKW